MDVIKHLDDYEEQSDLIQPIQMCLCKSIAYAKIICDPTFCAQQLSEKIDWVKTTDNTKAAMGGVAKQIYRMYAAQRNIDNTEMDSKLSSLLDKVLGDD